MQSKEEILNLISHATCTGKYHKFSSVPRFPLITDGVLALAEAGECYWFLDLIGSYQNNKKLDKSFQVWKLTVHPESSTAVVEGYNDMKPIITQEIPYTDFPLSYLKLFLVDGVILLPSEY